MLDAINSVLDISFFKVFMVHKNTCKGRNYFCSVILICAGGAQANTELWVYVFLTRENN